MHCKQFIASREAPAYNYVYVCPSIGTCTPC